MLPLRSQRAKRAGAAEPAIPTPPVKPATAPDGRAKRIKDAAEAATAVAKAALFAGAIAIVGAVIATTLWRDRHARHVEVSIDAEADKTLRAMGSQIDLRQTFVDVLNARIRGVEQVFALNFAQLIDTRDAPDVSFKPFGLDASTGQITKIARELTGAAPPTSVRIELLCPKAKCDDAGAPGSTLLVTVIDREGSERLAVPIGGTADGLPRRLRDAMRRSADLLLERAEPLISAVYYLNAAQQHTLPEDVSSDLQRSMRSALKLRDADGRSSCIANLIIGGTLFKRGIWEDGLVFEQRAAETGDRVCAVHAATNVVFFFFPFVCQDSSGMRDFALMRATEAFAPTRQRGRAGLPDIVGDRIPQAEQELEMMRFLNDPGMEPARRAFCQGHGNAAVVPGRVEAFTTKTLEDIRVQLPPRAGQRAAQAMIDATAMLASLTLPRVALAARYRTALALLSVIETYAPTDPAPRRLFALRGRIAIELTAVAVDAIALNEPERLALLRELGVDSSAPGFDTIGWFRLVLNNRGLQARVDFQNALAAADGPALGQSAIDVDLRNRQGDAALLLGDLPGATDGYGRAIDAFVTAESPIDQLVPLAETLLRLFTIDRRKGLCAGEASTIDGKQSVAARLGIARKDWCALADPATATRPGLVGVVAAMVQPAIDRCDRFLDRDPTRPFPISDWMRCLQETGPATAPVLRAALGGRDASTLRVAIDDALKGGG